MNKRFFSFIIAISFAMTSFAQVTEFFSVGNPLKFCGKKYSLVWSMQPRETYYVQEYLPKGEDINHYDNMISVNIFMSEATPMQAMSMKIKELDERKKNDPIIHYLPMENDGECMLEFIVSEHKDDKLSCVEANVYHYRQVEIDGKKALVVTFYSGRAYGDDILPYMKDIPNKREAWYKGLEKLKKTPVFKAK